jgi:rod shape-determining protein MreC
VALYRRTGRSRVTLVLLILTSIAVLTLESRDSSLVNGMRDGAATALGPLRDIVATATRPVTNAFHGATDYGDLESENQRLRERIAQLEGERYTDKGAAEELAALEQQLEIPWIGDIPTARARVVAGPTSNFTETIEIDKGTSSGIKAGMPVVSKSGLVGRIVEASAHRATISLLTDKDFRVGVRIASSNAKGTASGGGRDKSLRVDSNADPKANVKEGTLLYTTGADRSAFPASIPVGKVTSSRVASGGLALELVVDPLVDVGRLTFLTVLLWEPAR